MQLSVIIVSYNCRYFVDQCLSSVLKSETQFDFEVILVDNASADNTIQEIREKYPTVKCIANKENVGFSAGNNIGIRQASSPYVLLLNPDTIVRKDTFQICYEFMESEKKAGAVGVRMYDGGGVYLPESKRGFPSPFVAFCKIFGLSKIFPKSPLFNRYYLGHLDENEIQEIDVLTGAFMFMRKTALDKSGLLDEAFFMYGEDIDLSYRIQKAGFSNYYLPTSSIIHYKGESTRKTSFNYIRNFYNAMLIFARKHFSKSTVQLYQFSINTAIYLNAFISFLRGIIKKSWTPILDLGISTIIFIGVKNLWAKYYFNDINYFSDLFYSINLPCYLIFVFLTFLFLGKYHRHFKTVHWLKIIGITTIVQLVIYSLMPTAYRPSRMVLVLSMTGIAILVGLKDWLLESVRLKNIKEQARTIIVGDPKASNTILKLLDSHEQNAECVGFVVQEKMRKDSNVEHVLGEVSSVDAIARFYSIDQIIFDQSIVDAETIMKTMTEIGSKVNYKLFSSNAESLISSPSKNFRGQVHSFDLEYAINDSYNKFIKRAFDVISSPIIFILIPLLILVNKKNRHLFKSCVSVFFGKNTWIAYVLKNDNHLLPKIQKGIFSHFVEKKKELNESQKAHLDFLYAREYRLSDDINALINNLQK